MTADVFSCTLTFRDKMKSSAVFEKLRVSAPLLQKEHLVRMVDVLQTCPTGPYWLWSHSWPGNPSRWARKDSCGEGGLGLLPPFRTNASCTSLCLCSEIQNQRTACTWAWGQPAPGGRRPSHSVKTSRQQNHWGNTSNIKHIFLRSVSERISLLKYIYDEFILLDLATRKFYLFIFCQMHKDTIQMEWQGFLNLCLAQEVHLNNVDAYKKVETNRATMCHITCSNRRLKKLLIVSVVPARCRDFVRVFGQTQFHTGSKVAEQKEQPRGPDHTGGTVL